MPKSRNNRKERGKRKGPHTRGPVLPTMDMIRTIAKELDTPEFRELYRSQKAVNPDLDNEVDELTEEVEEILNHGKDSK